MPVPIYTPILDSEIEPGDEPLASIFVRLRNNYLAAMGVDSTNPTPIVVPQYDFEDSNEDYYQDSGAAAPGGAVSIIGATKEFYSKTNPSELDVTIYDTRLSALHSSGNLSLTLRLYVTADSTGGASISGASINGAIRLQREASGRTLSSAYFPIMYGSNGPPLINLCSGISIASGASLAVALYNTERGDMTFWIDITEDANGLYIRTRMTAPSWSTVNAGWEVTTWRTAKKLAARG